ncbi:hypothetical protein IG631_01943 [Alternaria alternata]|nr:hypothetical protein IG631_01943 [Alternaria alternata]
MCLISIHAVSEALKPTITRHCRYVNAVLFCNSWPDNVGQLNIDNQHPETLTPATFERPTKEQGSSLASDRIECSSKPREGFKNPEVLECVDSVLSGHRIAPDNTRTMPTLLGLLPLTALHKYFLPRLNSEASNEADSLISDRRRFASLPFRP